MNTGSSPYCLSWRDRPEELQIEIETAFNAISGNLQSSWSKFNGEEDYRIAGIREYGLAEALIQNHIDTRREFYFLDIGAGNFQWGQGLARWINKRCHLPLDAKIHIIGIRGEGGQSLKEESGFCILYSLTAFKVEKLWDEFKSRGFDLANHLDLIVSRWCFRHLADPLGTFLQAYELVRPKTGLLLMDGFFFCDDKASLANFLQKEGPNGYLIDLLVQTKAPFLIHPYYSSRSLAQFLLRRRDNKPCHLSMRYASVQTELWHLQTGSKCITRFEMKSEVERKGWNHCDHSTLQKLKGSHSDQSLYGDKRLYNWLRSRHLIAPNWIWLPCASSIKTVFTLHAAVGKGDIKEVEAQMEKCDLDETDELGEPPLGVAIAQKQKDVVELLLERGANPNIPNYFGKTALELAEEGGDCCIVAALKQRGAVRGIAVRKCGSWVWQEWEQCPCIRHED